MANRDDPYAQFNFLIEIDDVTIGGFTEASGLNTESDVIEYRNGDEPTHVRKLQGLQKYGNITLKRGITKTKDLWDWRLESMNRDTESARRSGAIILRDEAGNEVMRWTFFDGWVSKFEAPSLNSTSNEAAIESIEIVHERLEFEV